MVIFANIFEILCKNLFMNVIMWIAHISAYTEAGTKTILFLNFVEMLKIFNYLSDSFINEKWMYHIKS